MAKYQNLNIKIDSKEKAKLYNEKIVYLIKTNSTENIITNEQIYNTYTEKGALHDLKFNDFENFNEFSKAKNEFHNGQFFTPDEIIESMYSLIQPSKNDMLADLTAGKGNFINFANNESNFYANEIDSEAVLVMKHIFPKANITCGDIRNYNPNCKFNIIFGNPPFNLDFDGMKSQYYYFIKSSELLLKGGFLVILVPQSFLADDFFNKTQIENINKDFSFVGQCKLSDDTFDNANIKTKIMVFQKNSEHIKHFDYNNDYIENIEELQDLTLQAKVNVKNVSHKLFLENFQHSNNNYSFSNPKTNIYNGYEFKLKKYLFEIKQHFPEKYNKALELIEKFKTQRKPADMSDELFNKTKLTENKVLANIKKYLKVKSKKTKIQEISSKKLNRMNRVYNNEMKSFEDIQLSPEITAFLDQYKLFSNKNEDYIKLTKHQANDCNKMLQKQFGYLQYSQGAGKTICSLFQMQYRLYKKQVNKIYIVSHALCVGHWEKVLSEEFNIEYKTIKTLKDIENDCSINLVSFYYLGKYQKHIKKQLDNKNTMLILDEADNISSINSKTYKSVLNVFRKVNFKLLLSGTMTRNNINESFTQFELLYNNSKLFNNNCRIIYIEDAKKKKNESEINTELNKPFKPYKKGYNQFVSCFSPTKSTVFGIKKQNQDVYNYTELKQLIDRTIITRCFEEVVGKKLYKLNQINCKMNHEEIELYKQISNEFYSLEHNYFNSTGNDRKNAMLKIIRQLNLLLKSCSTPQLFLEYNGKLSNKSLKLVETIKQNNFNNLAIGCIRIDTVKEYEKLLQNHFPEKKIYVVTGQTHNVNQRKELVKQLEKETDYILISTIQSLQSSLNINFIDNVIIPELPYNYSKLSQYFFRFIRFDSVNFKNVYFLTYEYSIEQNLINLILNKEKLNRIMKSDNVDTDALLQEFGIEYNLFDMLHEKELDKENKKTYITWDVNKIIN